MMNFVLVVVQPFLVPLVLFVISPVVIGSLLVVIPTSYLLPFVVPMQAVIPPVV